MRCDIDEGLIRIYVRTKGNYTDIREVIRTYVVSPYSSRYSLYIYRLRAKVESR